MVHLLFVSGSLHPLPGHSAEDFAQSLERPGSAASLSTLLMIPHARSRRLFAEATTP